MRVFFSGIALLLATAFAALAQTAGPQGAPRGPLNEQIHLIPFDGRVLLHTIVFRPDGDRPVPLVIINHGSPRSAADRPGLTARFAFASEWFVRRGFAVAVPTRRGYGQTGGGWAEDSGSCNSPDYFSAGRATAADIRAALVYMREQPFVDRERVVLVGQSAAG
jgi:dienelactone hydrolase